MFIEISVMVVASVAWVLVGCPLVLAALTPGRRSRSRPKIMMACHQCEWVCIAFHVLLWLCMCSIFEFFIVCVRVIGGSIHMYPWVSFQWYTILRCFGISNGVLLGAAW